MYTTGSKESPSDETFLAADGEVTLQPQMDAETMKDFDRAVEKVNPPATVLSKEDRLEAENLQLRIMLLISSKESFVRTANETIAESFDKPLSDLRNRISELQHVFGAKYGIDFKTQEIEPETGRVIPARTKK